MAGISAIYVSATTFTITGDQTSVYNTGRRIKAICSSVNKYGTVENSTYTSLTTVVLTATSDALNSGLTKVYYGIAADSIGSLPTHTHDTTEGEGGVLTLINLSDTPVSYNDTKYLRSTASGTEWSTVSADHSTLNELDYASSGHIGFAQSSHSHTESDISDLDKYTEAEVDTISGSLNTKIDGKSDTGHTHDDRYYTEGEVDTISGSLQTNIDGKSDTSHTHDDRYYTESEIDTISGTLSDEIDSDIATHTSNADAHHSESHTVASHSDTTATGANLNELVGSGDTTLHKHDGQYYTESEIDTISGSLNTKIDGKSDTGHTHDDRYYTETEVDTISGSLNTKISAKPDTEWFLTEGVPSDSIGEINDIAMDQTVGDVYKSEEVSICSTTWNPSDKSSYITLSNGNLTAVCSSSTSRGVRSIASRDSGKWYWEVTVGGGGVYDICIGIANASYGLVFKLGQLDVNGYSYGHNGYTFHNGPASGFNSYAPGDVIGVALDLDNGKIWWSKNGVWQSGNPSAGTGERYSGITGTWYAGLSLSSTYSQSSTANFGATSFSYEVPSGFTSGFGDISSDGQWIKKLSPDFLKLSDTPTTYAGSADKYLKTTNSGIEFADDLYTKSEVDTISGTLQTSIDSMPVTLLELEDTPTTYSGTDGYYVKTTNSGIEFETNIYWKSYEPFLDENYANVKGVPTVVNRGLFKGYSMPIWADPSNVDEELLFRIRVPFRWDGVTNPWFCAITSLSAAEDIGDKYKFQLEWQSGDVGYVLPATTAETITSEITITDGTAYFSYILLFEVDATAIVSGQNWQGRLRRIAASSSEVDNEPIVWHWCTRWKMNKLGTETTQGY